MFSQPASTTEQIVHYYADQYQVSEDQMMGVLKAESQLNPKAFNKSDPYGGAKGIAQFLQPTFDRYSKQVSSSTMDVWDVDDAVHVMAYMFSKKQYTQWTTWRRLYGEYN